MPAYEEARVLALRGLDFDAIVERLERDKGLDAYTARAAAAKALAPDHPPAVSLAAELAQIAARLDRAR
jgi:hypothetical protein